MSNTKHIIITGSSSGIGFGLCKYYLEQGHQVVGFSRRNNKELLGYPNFSHYQMDLTKGELVKAALEDLKEYFPKIDLLILNAGVLGEIKRMEQIDLEDAKDIMDINVWANKTFIDELLLQDIDTIQIAAISSGAAKKGSAGWGPYSISKAALNMLMQTYAAENPQIHFSAIAPGLVDTAMQSYISQLDNADEFPAIARLQAAKGTEHMPDEEVVAPRLDKLFKRIVKNEASGIFVDIRD